MAVFEHLSLFKYISGEILECLDQDDDSLSVRSVTNVAKSHLVILLKDQGIHLDVAASIGKLYSTTKSTNLLPGQPDWLKTTSLVVNLLSGYVIVTTTFPAQRIFFSLFFIRSYFWYSGTAAKMPTP